MIEYFFALAAALSSAIPVRAVPAPNCDARTVARIEHALDRGKGVLVVGAGSAEKCGDEDETCGDWAEYLNAFARERKSRIEVLKVPVEKWSRIVNWGDRKIPARSELFLAKNRPSFFYEGPIVEAGVYRSVINAWFAKPSAEDAAFLPGQVHATLCK